MSVLRRSLVLGAAALALGATTATAQMTSKPKEIRIDVASLSTSNGTLGVDLGFPNTLGGLAIAIYVNDNIAIEPTATLGFVTGDGFSGGNFGLGVMVPYYLSGGMGKSGFFVAPGLMASKGFGDLATDMALDFGVDIGIKREWKTNIGQRIALTLRDGDSYADMELGAIAGITIRWP